LKRQKNKFLEFKSVKDVPPNYFGEQFINDLKLPEVESLDQLKWYFDGSKVSGDLPKEKFMDILEKADIDESVIKKFITERRNPTKADLIDLISENFEGIFVKK